MTKALMPDPAIRDQAVKRLKKKRDFGAHLLIFVLVNTFLVVVWAVTSSGGFFWPIFPMVGWGIAVVMNAWDVWHGDEFSEAAINREIERLRRPD